MMALKYEGRADLSYSCLPHGPIDDTNFDVISWVELQDLSMPQALGLSH